MAGTSLRARNSASRSTNFENRTMPGHDLDFHMTTGDPEGVLQQVRTRCPDAAWESHVSGAPVLRLTDPDGTRPNIFAPGSNRDGSPKTWPDPSDRSRGFRISGVPNGKSDARCAAFPFGSSAQLNCRLLQLR